MVIEEKNMNILCITHADFESPGVIETWAQARNFGFKIVRPYRGEKLSLPDSFDMLIVMGGPQSPVRTNEFPYLIDEIKLIKEAILLNKKILGFCLGAQLIGEAVGGQTQRSPEKEIGVFPLTLNEEGMQDPLLQGFPHQFPVIHWHNDMPGLGEGSVLLGYSEGCPRQIIRFKPLVYGFQCHMEITLDGMKTMIEAVPEDLAPSKYTQSADELLLHEYESINNSMVELLDRFSNI
jgi:GMP synthase (glutamine-hydrolysing)